MEPTFRGPTPVRAEGLTGLIILRSQVDPCRPHSTGERQFGMVGSTSRRRNARSPPSLASRAASRVPWLRSVDRLLRRGAPPGHHPPQRHRGWVPRGRRPDRNLGSPSLCSVSERDVASDRRASRRARVGSAFTAGPVVGGHTDGRAVGRGIGKLSARGGKLAEFVPRCTGWWNRLGTLQPGTPGDARPGRHVSDPRRGQRRPSARSPAAFAPAKRV